MVSFRGQKSLDYARISLFQGFNSKFPTSIPTPFICGVPSPRIQTRHSEIQWSNWYKKGQKVNSVCLFLLIREFKIPRRRRRQKICLKSDSSIYETLVRLSQLVHYVLCKQTLPELNSLEKYPGIQRVREIRRRMFTLSIKREIRQFTSQSCSDDKEMYKKA